MKLYNISFNNLNRRRGKMIFLISGLVIGIATIVTLLSITESMSSDIEKNLNQFGANIVMTPKNESLSLSYGDINVGGVNYQVKEFDEASIPDIRKIKNHKNLGIVAPKVLGSVKIKDRNVLLMGVNFEDEIALKTWWSFNGKFPDQKSDIAVGSKAAAALNLKTGDELTLNSRTYRISGVLRPTGSSEDNIIIADLHEAQQILNKQGKISMVEISAFCQGCPISEMTLQIAEKFPEARVTALKQAVMSKMQSIELFKSFSYGISALVILIGALLVFITMMGSVNERTREIGIFRAIGFRRGHVMQIILLEAMIVGFVGGFIGLLSGNGIAWAVIPQVMKGGTFAGINLSLGGISMLLSISLSLLASLYPAVRASSLDPSEALRVL
ncbi:MAG: ABC transporter permease [Deltaproteobacteria bacterium]|nr:ABC transporter permease [Deltaproteobacteria bacterium]